MPRFPFARLALLSALLLPACDGGSAATEGGGGDGGSGATTDTPTPMECAGESDHAGKATYYNEADGSGACSFDPSPGDLMIGAMNAPDYQDSGACGACVAIDGPDGNSIAVRIVDLCPGCGSGHIDLSPDAFAKLADKSLGEIQITWRYVSCNYPGPIQYKFKEGSNQWWTAVQVRNHTHRIAKFEYEKDGAFVEVPRFDYNYFIDESGMGPGPYHFRVTDVTGQTLEDEGIGFVEGGVVEGKGQFPPCPSP